jgi:hypothetical protein
MHVQNLVVKNAIKNDPNSQSANLNGGSNIKTDKNEVSNTKKG